MSEICYVCKEKMSWNSLKIKKKVLLRNDLNVPAEMGDDDRICVKCNIKLNPDKVDENGIILNDAMLRLKVLEQQRKEVNEVTEEIKQERKEELQDLLARGQDYKKIGTRTE